MNLNTRCFSPDLVENRSAGAGDGRTFHGIVVPYDKVQVINPHLTEVFRRGVFRHQLKAAHRVKVGRDHAVHTGGLIGRFLELREDASGLYGSFRISPTPLGEETIQLIRDGALDQLSVGFYARQDRTMQDGVVERLKADLVEVSVVVQGAYGDDATILGDKSDSTDKQSERSNMVKAQTYLDGLKPPPPML